MPKWIGYGLWKALAARYTGRLVLVEALQSTVCTGTLIIVGKVAGRAMTTTIHETIINLHVREAVALLRLLDGSDQDRIRHATNYGIPAEEWTQWVNVRIKKQLEKASERSKRFGPFAPVTVASCSAERLSMVWKNGNAVFTGETL